MLARQPQKHIHIVTTLCEYHGARLILSSPISPYKAMCHMIIAHILDALYCNDIPYAVFAEQFIELSEERSIAKHVTDD